jgi:hypothetical protein
MLQLERTKAEAEVSYLVQYNRGEGDEGHVLQALQDCHQGEGDVTALEDQSRGRGKLFSTV